MVRITKYLTYLFAFLTLIGCTAMGLEEKYEEKHYEHVYDVADNYVTFPYHLPHFEDYTIVGMHYESQDEESGTELDRLEIEGKEVIYDHLENVMTSHGTNSYFIFEVEEDGTYYRVYVEVTSKMTKDEVEEQIKEMSSAILS